MFTHYSDLFLGPELASKRKKYERILLKIHHHGTTAMFNQGDLKISEGETIYQAYDRHYKTHLQIISKYDRYEVMLDKAYRNLLDSILS